MPPKTRGSKTLKISKENVGLTNRVKLKALENTEKPQRKVLSDKTNSASDDNANSSPLKNVETYKFEETELKKPRRKRKLPARYLENQALVSLCNSNNEKISPTSKPVKSKTKKKIPIKKDIQKSPLKTTSKILSNSILKSRPKRVCRIPSNLEGHSVSPIKYIPLQPVSTSTPVANKTVKNTAKNKNTLLVKTPSPVIKNVRKQLNKKKNAASAADTNNNGKKQQQIDKCFEKQIQSGKSKKVPSNSFRVFDDIKKSQKRNSVKNDPYEFTFDPDEEPPQKKKKKRLAKPRQPKPKTAIKGAYEKNLAKALATLKNTLAMKTPSGRDVQVLNSQPVNIVNNGSKRNDAILKTQVNEINRSIPCANNYNSVRIEDIAMDLQEPNHTLDYSPVNSPQHSVPTVVAENLSANKKDPLNLRDSLSFFDDQPVASSSMNASIRHPTASPWRIEFGSLPIKWPVNSYVKPNMTPAVESSYINFNDSKKKHVYTNIVPINDTLPQEMPQETSLKQTSIISFIKEVAERNAKKKMKSTPVKSNSLFEDISNKSLNVSPTKSVSKNNSKESNSGHIDVIDENVDNSITKTPEKSNSTKCGTFFGFDDTEEDQENVSPLKKDKRRALRPRSKVVLQEINNVNGPSRATIPVSVKSKLILNSDPLNNDFEDPKLGLEPPLFPVKETRVNGEKTNLNVEDDDSNSVHLFEDIDLIHHYHQPPRKSYGKAKKVTFRQNSATDSDVSNDEEQVSDKEVNLDDLSFKLPSTKPKRVHKKKLTKKQKISKKEEQELENWATGFNSMCHDVEEFDLIVE